MLCLFPLVSDYTCTKHYLHNRLLETLVPSLIGRVNDLSALGTTRWHSKA